MNFKQSEPDDLGDEGDYIILLQDSDDLTNMDHETVKFKKGTVFEIIYEDQDDMGCYYSVELKDGKPGNYVDRNKEYHIPLYLQEKQIEGNYIMTIVPKSIYELKHSLKPSTTKTFEDIIDEL
jgi:hypothetical protein